MVSLSTGPGQAVFKQAHTGSWGVPAVSLCLDFFSGEPAAEQLDWETSTWQVSKRGVTTPDPFLYVYLCIYIYICVDIYIGIYIYIYT